MKILLVGFINNNNNNNNNNNDDDDDDDDVMYRPQGRCPAGLLLIPQQHHSQFSILAFIGNQ